jgi:NAD(P)-dependent dehydrogenase (short-subunit alcohol dehydrogenase family)
MRKQGSGAIVNCSSIGGIVGRAGIAAHHGAKHGMIGLTRSVALEYAERGIRINAVRPGTIDTPMVSDVQVPRSASAGRTANTLLSAIRKNRIARPR